MSAAGTIRPFSLSSSFIEEYKNKQPEWGYSGLGYVVYTRTYARTKEDGSLEEFWETCQRVVEGTYNVQKKHCHQLKLPWDDRKAQRSAQEMFKRMWQFKWLPPGRGLWMMGTPLVDKIGSAALNNCGMVSTADINVDFAEPFCWLMDMLMLGVGIGFDTKGAGKVKIQKPTTVEGSFVVDDSREGWVSLLRVVLNSYVGKGSLPASIDYSKVRPAGSPIKGFGGVASGPEPLKELIESVKDVLNPLTGEHITASAIVDISNLVGRCVVAGNVRRSAQIAFGNPDDDEFLNLKNPDLNKEALYHHRWSSNNSVFAFVGMDYSKVAELTAKNGEPGYEWLENARKFSRMGRDPDYSDMRVAGANPCFSGDTLVAVADGRHAVSFKQLAEEGKDVPVYSLSPDGKVEIKWGRNPRKTRENAKLVRIHLDTGAYLDVTPDHKFILRDGTIKHAKDLNKGDSLPRFTKKLVPVKDGGKNYYQIVTDINNPSGVGGRVFEHQLVAKFFQPEKCAELYDEAKARQASASLKASKAVWDKEYYLEQERTTDLETVWVGERLFAKKVCEHCGTGFVVPWGKRDRLYCSAACFNVYLQGLEARNNGQRTAFTHRQQGILHEQIMIYKDLQSSLSRDPSKKEWETACKTKNISYRFRSGASSSKNPYALTSFEDLKNRAEEYNHRVVRVEELEGEHDVYNITVDTFHTLSVVLSGEPGTDFSGIYINNCVEQSLEDRELCCLVETFPGRHDSVEDFKKTLKYAYLYAKTVTLIPTHDARTNTVLMRNRRIGCSMSGITQAIQKFGRRTFLSKFCDEGYTYLKQLDQLYSDWLCVRPSIKITSVKPSGSVSLLPGVTPGIHFPHAEYYIRRVRLQANSPLVTKLYIAGYPVEDDKYSPNTKVVSFPIKETNFDRSKDQVTMWEQLELAAALQQYWADNQVSVTVTFNKAEAKDIKYALELYETRLKGVSFLPLSDHGYEQAPYETITKEQYEEMIKNITPLSSEFLQHEYTSKFCDGESCEI